MSDTVTPWTVLAGSSVHGILEAKNTRVGSSSLIQGIFPTQRSNPGLLHCRWILYHLSHREAQEYWSILEYQSLSLLQGIFPTQESKWSLLHCRWILYQLSYLGSPSRREARVKLSISSLCRVFFRINFSCCDRDPKLPQLYSHPGTQGK